MDKLCFSLFGIVGLPVLSFQMTERMSHSVFFSVLFALLCSCTLLGAEGIEFASEIVDKFKAGSSFSDTITIGKDINFAGIKTPLGTKSDCGCVKFAGTLDGKGFTFRNFVTEPQTSGSGLFCELDGATIKNLVIDSSCSFSGFGAGGLSPLATGTVTITNVTIKASISVNDDAVGGFIGRAKDATLKIQNSTFNGTIAATGGIHGGGFIGLVQDTSCSNITINNCTNIGTIRTGTDCGGFVGTVSETSNAYVTITNSISSGTSLDSDYNIGGFIGRIYNDTKVNATIINSVNNCELKGLGSNSVTSGFIGLVNPDQDSSISVLIRNCMNNGNMTTVGPKACGFFCVESNNQGTLKTTVENSINKGRVDASYAYGIADKVSNARNVVSIGELSGSSKYTFWDRCSNASLIYCLKDKGFNVANTVTYLVYNHNTLLYGTNESERADNLLNQETVKQQYGMVWKPDLTLVQKLLASVSLTVDGKNDRSIFVAIGATLGSDATFCKEVSYNQYVIVNCGSGPRQIINLNDKVYCDMDIIVGNYVNISFGIPYNTTWEAVTGEVLERAVKNVSNTSDQFIIVDSKSKEIQHNTTLILEATHFLLCHNVTVSGVLNTSFPVEHNQTLGNEDRISKYFTPDFIVTNKTNPSQVLKSDYCVTADTHVVIKNITILEVIIRFDDIENITAEDVEEVIRDISSDLVVGVDVIRRDDGSFVVSVKSNDDGTNGVLDALDDCLNPSS